MRAKRKQRYVPRYRPKLIDPVKFYAQQKLRQEVRAGRIIKPDRCQMCKRLTPAHKLSGHHHNGYDRWWDIIWLCHDDHALVHKMEAV